MPSQKYLAGVATDRAAKQYQVDHPGTSYENALRAVVHEATYGHQQKLNAAEKRYEQEHGRPVPDSGWRIYEDANGEIIDLQLGDSKAIGRLSNIITGLPRLADHSIDVELALKIVRGEFPELCRQACGAFLGHQAQVIRGRATPIENVTPETAMQEAQRQFPEVASVYSGNRQMSESVLRTVLFPIFKTEQKTPPAPNERSYQRADDALDRLYYPGWKSELPSVRRYSSDHIRYDANGNQYRRY